MHYAIHIISMGQAVYMCMHTHEAILWAIPFLVTVSHPTELAWTSSSSIPLKIKHWKDVWLKSHVSLVILIPVIVGWIGGLKLSGSRRVWLTLHIGAPIAENGQCISIFSSPSTLVILEGSWPTWQLKSRKILARIATGMKVMANLVSRLGNLDLTYQTESSVMAFLEVSKIVT